VGAIVVLGCGCSVLFPVQDHLHLAKCHPASVHEDGSKQPMCFLCEIIFQLLGHGFPDLVHGDESHFDSEHPKPRAECLWHRVCQR